MKRAYFQYYESFEKIVQKFKTTEEQNALRSKIIEYGLYGTEPAELSEKEDLVWDTIKDMIDDQLHRREVNTNNRKGKNNSLNEEKSPEETKTTDNEKKGKITKNNENEEKTTNENEEKSPCSELKWNGMDRNGMDRNEMKRNEENREKAPEAPHSPSKHFIKPTLEEVQDYCNERQNGINPQHFLDYYEARGWKIGKNSMKDWKAAIRTWEQQRQDKPAVPDYTEPARQLPADRLTL